MNAMDDLYATARRYLKQHHVLNLATCSESDIESPVQTKQYQTWVAPVFYALHLEQLIFLSAAHTRHCQNLANNPLASGSIVEDYSDWKDIKGFQLEGVVAKIDVPHVSAAVESYAEKYAVVGDDAPPAIAKALSKVEWFALRLTRVFFIDNAKGLGHRDELDLGLLFSQ